MANLKGTVEFTSGGKNYTLLLDFNVLCDLEDELPGLMDGTAELNSPRKIRRVFQAGLVTHQPEVSLQDAGAIIQDLGFDVAGQKIKEAFDASFPSTKGGEGAARPPKAKAGAGKGR